jgi:DNA-binding GntR family transcriptional regulator
LTPRPAQAAARREVRHSPSEAYLLLRDLIISGQLSPGAAIIESQAAARLGLGRTPVRAALKRLQQEGYVHALTTGKYTRAVVAPLTGSDMRELFLIMGALEGLAARLCSRLEASRREMLVAEMDAVNQGLLQVAGPQNLDERRAQDLHVRFHRIHVEAAAGPRLLAELDAIHPQVERYERLYTAALIRGIAESVREHGAIGEAIRSGDPDAAERAVGVNWRNGADRYEKVVAQMGERGIW